MEYNILEFPSLTLNSNDKCTKTTDNKREKRKGK